MLSGLDNSSITYVDYAHYERLENWSNAQLYWTEISQNIPVPVKKRTPSRMKGNNLRIAFDLDPSLVSNLTLFMSQSNLTIFHVGLASFLIYLSQLSKSQESEIWTSIIATNRYRSELQNIVGLFTNIVPFSLITRPKQLFIELCRAVQEKWLEMLPYLNLHYQEILKLHPSFKTNTLFSATISTDADGQMLVLEDDLMLEKIDECFLVNYLLSFDMLCLFHENRQNNTITVSLNGSLDVYDESIIISMTHNFKSLLYELCSNYCQSTVFSNEQWWLTVKVKNYSEIELNKIKTVLMDIVINCAIVKVMHNDTDYLVAYVQTDKNPHDLHQHCISRLPSDMVPSLFLIVDRFSMNEQDEIAKDALSPLNLYQLSLLENSIYHNQKYIEQRLQIIWCAVLSQPGQIPVLQNFDTLGGSSSQFIQLLNLYQSEFKSDYPLQIRTFLGKPTIANHAELLYEAKQLALSKPFCVPSDSKLGSLAQLEVQLQNIFTQVFNSMSIDISTSFCDLQDFSLNATKVLKLIHEQLNIDINMKVLTANTSIRRLANALTETNRIGDVMNYVEYRNPLLSIETLAIVVLILQYIFPVYIAYCLSIPIFFSLILIPLFHLSIYICCFRLLRIAPGKYQLFSLKYYQFWFLNRLWRSNKLWLQCIADTPFFNYYLRMCGARIGDNVHVCTTLIDIPDSLSIGDNTFIADEVYLNNVSYDVHTFSVHAIKLGSSCIIGTRAVLHETVHLSDTVIIDSLAVVTGHITSGQNTVALARYSQSFRQNAMFAIWQFLAIIGIAFLHSLSIKMAYAIYNHNWPFFMSVSFCWLIWLVMYLMTAAITLRYLVGHIKAGSYSLNSWSYFRCLWLRQLIVSAYCYQLSYLGGYNRFGYVILRFLGTHFDGHDVILSDMPSLIRFPSNLLSIGDHVSLFGGVQLVPFEVVPGNQCLVDHIRIDEDAQAGNFCSIHCGTHIPKGMMIGALTRITKNKIPKTHTKAIAQGIPALIMPFVSFASVVKSDDDQTILHRSYTNAILIYFHQMLGIAGLAVVSSYTVSLVKLHPTSLIHVFSLFAVYVISRKLLNIEFLLPNYLNKQIQVLLGQMIDHIVQFLQVFIEGSQWLVYFHRFYGANIRGSDVILCERFNISDHSMINIGEHVRICFGSSVMAHTYEGRIYKTGRIVVGDQETIKLNLVL